MIVAALIMFTLGIALSAFFSGAETGFYRVTRVRLMLDALGGDWIGRGLLWLANRPSMFVATTLVGNNLANSLTSLAVVIGTQAVFSERSYLPEVIAPIVLAPLIFIYGELLPKHVFYQAPNRLLRQCGPALLVCTLLFLPISLLLWGFSLILQALVGATAQPPRMVLARRELEQVLIEGHQAGVLRPTQRGLAQGLFAMANQPIRQFATPVGRIPRANPGMTRADISRLARRHRLQTVPVEERRGRRRLLGYLRVIDLYLMPGTELPPLHPLIDLPENDRFLPALSRLMRSPDALGRIVSTKGQTVGFITVRQLSEMLFRGP